MAEQAYWSQPERGSREDRALQWLASVEPPRGIVVPSALWKATARASGLRVHQIKRLARRAAAADDPRVGWNAEHLARLSRRTPRGPTDLSRARMANWLRKRGLPWRRIAHVLSYSERDSGADARKAAALYRERLANGGTLPRARLAYLRRGRGEPWAHIARKVGYAGARSAREMAKRYAARAGLPWPCRCSTHLAQIRYAKRSDADIAGRALGRLSIARSLSVSEARTPVQAPPPPRRCT